VSFYTEAHPIDRPDLMVPVIYSANSSQQEIRIAYDTAAHEAALKRVAESAGPCAVVFACHEVVDTPSI
jgi:hypothetical protein